MSDPTELHLPPNLPYPIKIVSLALKQSQNVERGSQLLTYSFRFKSPASPEERPETRFGTWDSAIEGTLEKWNFKEGENISQRKARETPAVLVTEPCKHGMQLGGLCCICGKDMTSTDYTGFQDASRASIQMTHLANGPTVSFEEAQRIERETAEHLLKSRKLSLIVDLDQTIVHATVDPTVGEWITEGEAWEARQAKKAGSSTTPNGDTNADKTASEDDDEVNPNWEALKDVKKFRLSPEVLTQHDHGFKRKGRDKGVEHDGCMYYIKPRPGWQDFLETVAKKYEMHVYTMGTRAYAEEVCTAIDPEGKIFGGRILSRDESGSLTQKSLQRLFPCDQSMVVIIDDRADVWEWSPNLVKVIPYDFFVGIGDINSAFLPKLAQLAPELPPEAAAATAVTTPIAVTTPSLDDEVTVDQDTETSEVDEDGLAPLDASFTVPSQAPLVDEERTGLSEDEIIARNTSALDAQMEERPLAKAQEELQETPASTSGVNGTSINDLSPAPVVKSPKVVRKALLKNDDIELARVQKILEEVHQKYYDAYDRRDLDSKSKKKKRPDPSHLPYNVQNIIPQLRANTLDGVHILFSSVIPLDTRPESTEIWKTALAFGAQCYTELNPRITHVVAAKRGTVKVDAARRQGGIKIVWLSWFTDSIAFWQRQDETPYLLDPDTQVIIGPGSPPSDAHQISSDPEPDADDWDDDRRNTSSQLELNEIDWDEVNNEVDAAMNESDDEDEDEARSERSGLRSTNASDDEGTWTDETNSIISSATSTPKKKRKRLRSITPSDVGTKAGIESDVLRSPLAKRKKIAADRAGASKLKEAFSPEDAVTPSPHASDKDSSRVTTPNAGGSAEEDMDESEDGSEAGLEDEDDFLAREFGEDWG